jgi:hypothetical protein
MREQVKRNFILQLGFEEPAPAVCPRQYSALHFQPRSVFVWIVAGILFQSPSVFYVLCAVLWWSALFPKLNPFDALYNLTFGGNRVGASFLVTSTSTVQSEAYVESAQD